MLRHGIVQLSENASAPSAQSPRNRQPPRLSGYRPFWRFHFFHGPPATRRADPDESFRKLVGNHARQSDGRLGYCIRHLISGGEGYEDP